MEMSEQQEEQQFPEGRFEDFIGIFDGAVDPQFCQAIMKASDHHHNINAVYTEDMQFMNSNAGRFDWAMDLMQMNATIPGLAERDLNDALIAGLDQYIHRYGHLKTEVFYTPVQKVQKTPAGGGYHVWHDENTSMMHSARKMVWMVYLNDDFEGGETEYLYYSKRIQPKMGTLLIWPAGLTHVHRGGLVLKGDKYVVTGWFYLASDSYAREQQE